MHPVRKALATCLVVGASLIGVALVTPAGASSPSAKPQAAPAAVSFSAPSGAVEVGKVTELPSGRLGFLPSSNLLNVAHTHQGTCPVNDCWTWILANGAVIRGNGTLMVSQYNYVLVVCSQKQSSGWKISNLGQWGPFGNDGAYYPYCVNPSDANGFRWNVYP